MIIEVLQHITESRGEAVHNKRYVIVVTDAKASLTKQQLFSPSQHLNEITATREI